MEDAYVIHGGKPLRGHVELSGAKNSALKVIIAALMFEGVVTIEHVPNITDVQELLHLLHTLGAQASHDTTGHLTIDPSGLTCHKVDLLHASKIRTSFMLFAPLLYRFGEALIPNPGGCRLGARSIDRVIEGMQALGVKVNYDSATGYYHAKITSKSHGTYTFGKPTHTGTELLILLSVFCEGTIVIHNAALEPEIDDLISFLNEGGARIVRKGSTISIEGVARLRQNRPYRIAPDRVEAATYAALALATQGDITISSLPEYYIGSLNTHMRSAGGGVERSDAGWRYFYHKPLMKYDIETAPFPGFLTDWQPLMAVLATQAHGVSTIHERIFENRFSYVAELHKLGAVIEYSQPEVSDPEHFYHFNYDGSKKYQQFISITGVQQLHGGVVEVADLRAGATLAIAALVAEGKSYVKGVSHLERGYERFVEKIQGVGGDIRKI